MNNFLCCVKVLGFAITGAIVFSGNSAIAQIKQDGNLPNNFGITGLDNIKIIQDSNQYETNLSQNFKHFSALITAYFNNNTSTRIGGLCTTTTDSSLNFADSTKIGSAVLQQNVNISNCGKALYNDGLDKTQNRNTDEDKQVTNDSLLIPGQRILISCYYWNGRWYSC
ncbi:MAG: hypothetical protein RMY36_023025 [Nostoc sp. SerVER01]|nr:hypothetical protein [Nostoc sp. SerVER01]